MSKALPVLAKYIYAQDLDTLEDATWALSYLSDGARDHIQAVIKSGVCRRLVDLLGHNSTSVQIPALRCIGNIATGGNRQTQVVIASGALPFLIPIFRSHEEDLREGACWTLSNILAGTPTQIQAVMDAELWPELVRTLATAEPSTRCKACCAVSNATFAASADQVKYMVEKQDTLVPLCSMLKMLDNQVVKATLEAIENILKAGELEMNQRGLGANPYAVIVEEVGGMHPIHNLQRHDNTEIQKIAYRIMETYFADEDKDGIEEMENFSVNLGVVDAVFFSDSFVWAVANELFACKRVQIDASTWSGARLSW